MTFGNWGVSMKLANSGACRKTPCDNQIPESLVSEQLCLDHFLDEAFRRTDEALQRSRSGFPIDSAGLEAMLADALDKPALVTREVEKITGRPATTFAQWVSDHRNLFAQSLKK